MNHMEIKDPIHEPKTTGSGEIKEVYKNVFIIFARESNKIKYFFFYIKKIKNKTNQMEFYLNRRRRTRRQDS